MLMALTDTGINAYAIPKQCKARMPLKPANKFSFLQSPIPSTPFLHLSFPPSLPPLFLSVPLSHVCALGSGPRYQILSHVFARCASQKTHGHARIARVLRAILPNEREGRAGQGDGRWQPVWRDCDGPQSASSAPVTLPNVHQWPSPCPLTGGPLRVLRVCAAAVPAPSGFWSHPPPRLTRSRSSRRRQRRRRRRRPAAQRLCWPKRRGARIASIGRYVV